MLNSVKDQAVGIVRFAKENNFCLRIKFVKADNSERISVVNFSKVSDETIKNIGSGYFRAFDEVQQHFITIHPAKMIEVNLIK